MKSSRSILRASPSAVTPSPAPRWFVRQLPNLWEIVVHTIEFMPTSVGEARVAWYPGVRQATVAWYPGVRQAAGHPDGRARHGNRQTALEALTTAVGDWLDQRLRQVAT
jgi:hypothetical protein